MKMNLKTLVGAAAIAGALGFPTIGVGAGVANAATLAPSIPGPVHTVQAPADLGPARAQPVDDWHGGDWGWGGRGDGGWGGWGDRGGWGWGDRGGWGWGC